MTRQAEEILKELPELLRHDGDFRWKVWRVLDEEFSSKKDLALVLAEIAKSRQEANERFEAIDRRFEAEDRRFEMQGKQLEGVLDLLKYETGLLGDISQRLLDVQKWVNVTVGGFQVRAGRGLEDAVAGTLRIALDMKDVDPSKIQLRRKVVDVEGFMGFPGRSYELDMLVTNGETWIFEAKSAPDVEDVERFNDKAEMAIANLKLTGVKKALITLGKPSEVVAACQKLGIKLG